MNNPCCKRNNCTNPFCQPHETCDDTCRATPITYDDEKELVTFTVPYFVFRNFTQEVCEDNGAAAFYQIWLGFQNEARKTTL